MATLTKDYQYLGQKFIGSSGGSLYVRLYAKYSEQDIANNRSYVYYQARSYYENGSYILDEQGTISVNGTGANAVTNSCTRPTTGETVVATTSGWVSHDSEGKKTVSGNATINFPNWGWSGTVTASADLPTIPRASGIACSSPNIGDNAIITIDKKSSNFTNTVTYEIGSGENKIIGELAIKTTETVLQLNTKVIEDQIYSLIPNSTNIQGKVFCTTYSGNTQIGSTQSAVFNLYAVKDVCKPNIEANIIDTNEKTLAITEDNLKLIKYISKPKVAINATANKSATIVNYNINLNDGQTSNSQGHTFDSIGSNSIVVNAVDSRGYDNPKTIDLSERMIDYIKLHIDTIDLQRPEGTSNEIILNLKGVWFNDKFNEKNVNAITISYKYRKSGDIDWIDGNEILPTIDNNNFVFNDYSLGNNYDYQEEYQFKIIVSDLLMSVGILDSEIITVPKGQEIIAIGDEYVNINGILYLYDKIVPCFAEEEIWEE